MREILFRGKRVDNGEWATGYYVQANCHWHKHGIHKDWLVESAAANGGWFVVHNRSAVVPKTVGQYTGIKDKNGRRIFDGDIVRITERGRSANGMVAFKNDYPGGWLVVHNDASCSLPMRTCVEVIGNIYDNPELLEVGNGTQTH